MKKTEPAPPKYNSWRPPPPEYKSWLRHWWSIWQNNGAGERKGRSRSGTKVNRKQWQWRSPWLPRHSMTMTTMTTRGASNAAITFGCGGLIRDRMPLHPLELIPSLQSDIIGLPLKPSKLFISPHCHKMNFPFPLLSFCLCNCQLAVMLVGKWRDYPSRNPDFSFFP